MKYSFVLLSIYFFITGISLEEIPIEKNEIFKVDEVKLSFDELFNEAFELLKDGDSRNGRQTDLDLRQISEEAIENTTDHKENTTNLQNDSLSDAKPTSIQNDIIFNNFPKLPANELPIFWDNDPSNPQVPFPHKLLWLFAPLLRKVSNVINYLSHPNVALTPAFLLAKLRDKWQKIHKHIVEKIGGYNDNFEDYPFAYRKHLQL